LRTPAAHPRDCGPARARALFWWEPAKPICDGWAKQFVAMEGNPKGSKFEELPNFQLLVW
jgi:hypothetical protein